MDYLSVVLSGVGVNDPLKNNQSSNKPQKKTRFRPYGKKPRINIVFLKEISKLEEEKGYAICPVCDSIVPSEERSVHILENHSDKLCVCINCNGKIIYTPLYPHYHNKKGCMCITCMREAKNNLYCKACNKIFLDESNFKKHMKKHK